MALVLPNTVANGVNADGDQLNQNLQTIVTHVNTETINRDGSVAMTGGLLLPGAPTQPNQAATKDYVDTKTAASGGSGGPIGSMVMWHTGKAVPTGYLACQGQQISRTTYAALFAVIGTLYGAGNGSTTFTLPAAPVVYYYVPSVTIIRAL